jgi:hypothetical protein
VFDHAFFFRIADCPLPIADLRLTNELTKAAIGNQKSEMPSSTVRAVHHLMWIRRQVHRSFRVALSEIANDVEHRNRTHQLSVLYHRNIALTLVVHNGHRIADRRFRGQGRNDG